MNTKIDEEKSALRNATTDDDLTEADGGGKSFLLYGVNDTPSIMETLLYGTQQTLMSIGASISAPILIMPLLCVTNETNAKSEIISSSLFMCGLTTILQSIIGIRLPILQGGSHSFVPAIATLMALKNDKCIDNSYLGNSTLSNISNSSDPSFDPDGQWKERMREIQGGVLLASLTQILVGGTGLLGLLMQYIGPLTIAPTIGLIGLSISQPTLHMCQIHWGIFGITTFLLLLFSLYLENIEIPFPSFDKEKKKCIFARFPLFKVFPVLLSILIGWVISIAMTASGVLPNDKESPTFFARSDARIDGLYRAKWFYWPYPGQWGAPIFSLPSYIAMLAATIASMIESVGDYYACAKMCQAGHPPRHSMNRGIAMEGVGSIIAGLLGTGGASTSYTNNIGAIGFTHVASRSVFVVAGFMFMLSGIIGKFGALAAMIPDPVLGAILLVSIGLVFSVAVSSLKSVDMNSPRNQTIFGFSFLIGMVVPAWIQKNGREIQTGSVYIDQIAMILLGTPMLLGGLTGFILDNTVPGTHEERGLLEYAVTFTDDDNDAKKEMPLLHYLKEYNRTYDLPFITPWLRKQSWAKYLPFLPPYQNGIWADKVKCLPCRKGRRKNNGRDNEIDLNNTS